MLLVKINEASVSTCFTPANTCKNEENENIFLHDYFIFIPNLQAFVYFPLLKTLLQKLS